MAESAEVFKQRIAAVDESSGVIAAIKAHLASLGFEAKEVGKKVEHLHQPGVWQQMREHVEGAGGSFKELGEHVKGVGERIGELVPALSALGLAASVGGLFENVEHVADAYSEMAHTAQGLGISAQQLHIWNGVAKLTDTNADSMAKSMNRLNVALHDSVTGKNKQAAHLFREMHINPRHFHDAAAVLPVLADAFQHTADGATRASHAAILFGERAGKDMIPMLMLGADHIREVQEEVGKLQFNFERSGKALEAYHEGMAGLELAVGGLTDELGADLAPLLLPVVNHMRDWVAANRDWIDTEITEKVKELKDWIEHTDWAGIEQKFEKWGKTANDLADDVGGVTRVIEVLTGAVIVGKLVSFGAKVATIAGAFQKVTTAAEAAEAAAAAVSGSGAAAGAVAGAGAVATAGALAAGVAGTAVIAGGLAYGLSKATGYDPAKDHSTANVRGGTGRGSDNGPRHVYGPDVTELGHAELSATRTVYDPLWRSSFPAMGARFEGRVAPAPRHHFDGGERLGGHEGVEVLVRFENSPAGMTVAAKSSGGLPPAKIETGQAFPDYHR